MEPIKVMLCPACGACPAVEIDEADSREAMKRAQEYNKRQSERKVVLLKRKA